MTKGTKKKGSLADPNFTLPIDEYGIIHWDQVDIPGLKVKGHPEITEIDASPEDQRRFNDFKNQVNDC